jgi:hypothetical protein
MNLHYVLSVTLLCGAVGCCQHAKKDLPKTEEPMKQADTSTKSDAVPARVVGLEEGWELAPGGAVFTASQTPGDVIIKANGEHPSSNYEARLVQSPLRIWPPQYMLARKKTGDMGAMVMTPFEVTASFKADDPIREVVVTDAEGRHEVTVDQARD